jgi:hypothetical protein
MKKIIALTAVVVASCASPQSISQDKYYHFAAGATSAYVANQKDLPQVASAFAAGFAKETYDYIRNGKFDTKDLVATTLGGIVIKYVIKLIKNKKDVKTNKTIPKRYLGPVME